MSPLAPLGVEAALKAKEDPSFVPRPKIFDEFALTDRVGLVSGGNRGIGLETAIALAEAGARVVYCFDLAEEPSEVFKASREYVSKLGNGSRLEYFSADVRNQELLWKKAEEIGDKEQRFDFCIAAAGILKPETKCLEYPAQGFRKVSGHDRIGETTDLHMVAQVMDVNTTGVLFTAQAAGRQMARFGRGGSIILIASMSGSITNKVSRRSRLMSRTELGAGPRVGGIQYVQVCSATDGAKHGMRTWGAAYSSEHALARIHLHTVGGCALAVQV